MAAAFLAPAATPGANAPPLRLPAPAPLPKQSSVGAVLVAACRTASTAVIVGGALAVLGAGRHRRVALPAAVAVAGDAAAPPPPPPFQPSEQLGATAPSGFFDPLHFASVGDAEGFDKLRKAEIKHGRVAMMASVGLVVQHFARLPGLEKAPAGLGALSAGEGILGFGVLLLACGALELAWREEDGANPGDFGDPLGLKMYDEEMRTKEINNGRVAMISVLGIVAAELASGKDAVQQFGL